MPWAPGTILNGLPIWADVTFGRDGGPECDDYWAEVQEICWRKANGRRGKPIPAAMFERAEKADCGFADLTLQASEYLAEDEADRLDRRDESARERLFDEL